MIFLWAQRVHMCFSVAQIFQKDIPAGSEGSYIFPVGSDSTNDIPAGSAGSYTMKANISAGSAGYYTVNKFARCVGLSE